MPDDGRTEFERQQPGDVEVVDPEERHVVGDAVHRYRHVGGHEERATGAVGGIRVVRPLLLADLPLSLPHHHHAVPDKTENETARADRRSAGRRRSASTINSAQTVQKVESVDEDVVVGLKYVASVRAVARNPA